MDGRSPKRRRSDALGPFALLLVLLLTIPLAGCSSAVASSPSDPLLVSAAASLTDPFTELAQEFQQEHGVPVTLNFGASGQLAQQIEQGAPVDLFASANRAYVDELAQAGLLLPDTLTVYARGRLTLWVPEGSPLTLTGIQDLTRPEITRIALANPAHAPYGQAAQEALQAAGVWEEVRPKLVFGENIAQAYQYAETGNVDVAILALSLSVTSQGRWLLVPQELHRPLDQAMAVVAGAPQEELARAFLAFVTGPAGKAILERYGFQPVEARP